MLPPAASMKIASIRSPAIFSASQRNLFQRVGSGGDRHVGLAVE